jgi:hypothetical protein
MKVLELKGFKSLRALNTFSTLVLGLKMLPAYMKESYEEFLERLQAMPEADQRKMLLEAAQFVSLEKDEVEAVLSFCTDPNGVPFSSENIKQLGPDQLVEAIVSVCMEIVKIKIDLVDDLEKKK